MTKTGKPIKNKDTRWRVDYTCKDCGQQGTARFTGDEMIYNKDGDELPLPMIYCCICKSQNVGYEDIEEY